MTYVRQVVRGGKTTSVPHGRFRGRLVEEGGGCFNLADVHFVLKVTLIHVLHLNGYITIFLL